MSTPVLEVRDLHAKADDKEILRGIDLTILPGELHVIMGPNGAGKSTLANVIMANPGYLQTGGSIILEGEVIDDWSTDERARAGVFLAFQYPEEISGVSVIQFLRQSISARKGEAVSALEVRFSMREWMERLGMDPSYAERHLNMGFSGGEKKRNEILQMALLEPVLAVLDETDSGLDIDALKTVAEGIETIRTSRPTMGTLLITHYQRVLTYLTPDVVHISIDGRIVQSGGLDLVEEIEAKGYDQWRS